MKKMHRNMMITAGGLIIVGAVAAGAALAMGAGSIGEVRYKTEIIEAQTISIYSEYDNIIVEKSDGEEITIAYPDDREYSISDENGKYVFRINNKEFDVLEWYKHININFSEENTSVILSLPKDFTGEVDVESTGADIFVSDIAAGSMSIKSTYGDIRSENTDCELNASSVSGNVYVSGSGESVSAESEHGNIRICSSEYNVVSISAQSGDIKTDNISCKALYARNKSGDISGSKITSDSVDIMNDYGDTKIEEIKPVMLRAENRYGDIRLVLTGSDTDYSVNGKSDADNRIYVNSEYGDTSIEFAS